MTEPGGVEHWIRAEIRQLAAYHVPDARGLIKLDAMENPFTWPDELRNEWAELARALDVNRYPDPQATGLKRQLRRHWQIADDQAILLGNGSDELIQVIAMALAAPGRVLLSVDPGFVMYRMIAEFCGMQYVGVPLRTEDFALDGPALLEAIERHQPAVVFLAYPNNPTGNLFDEQTLLDVIDTAPGLVVIDEAYAPFTDASFLPRLGQHPNLLVMRTVSKMGLAGLRLGLLAGPSEWLDEFDKVRLPYNINVLTQAAGEFALRHAALFDAQTAELRRLRGELFERLSAFDGLTVFPSEANFLLLRTANGRAAELHAALREHGVLVKCLHGAHPLLADCLRVTVGSAQENAELLSRLARLL